MPIAKDQVSELLIRFDQTADLEVLKKALVMVVAATADPAATATRAEVFAGEKTLSFLAAFDAIDGKTIPNFNFDDRPPLTTAPPPESGLPAGVDPSSVADPELRARYEAEIAANRDKIKTYKLQSGLRKIDRDALEAFERHVAEHYRRADEQSLDKLIDGNIRSKARARSLRLRVTSVLANPH